jgi:diguanylate cyclase (GGDEF)-like protein
LQDNFAYLLPFIMLTFGVIFLFMRSVGHRAAQYWGIGYICAALGFATPVLLGSLPLLAQAVLANGFFFAAFFFYGHALLVQLNRPTFALLRAGFAVVALLAVTAHIALIPDLKRELIIADLSIALLLALPVCLAVRHTRNVFEKVMTGMVGLVVLETVIRVAVLIVMTPSGSFTELDEFLTSDYAYLMQIAASIIGFLMALSVLASLVSTMLNRHVHAAEHDPLTDILNRRGFDRVAPDFRGAAPSGVIVTCDIDHFKQTNDRFGHAAGDIVIIGLSELLVKVMPSRALVARFGGEEFVIFLAGYEPGEAGALANAIRMEFAGRDWSSRGITQQITASFGVSAIARGDHSIHDAIARADASLYMAKSGGRNQVVLEGARTPAAGTTPLRIISTN